MQTIHLSLALSVGLTVGWLVGTRAAPAPERTSAIAAIESAMTSIATQPNQCGFGNPLSDETGPAVVETAMLMPVSRGSDRSPLAALAVLRELRAGMKDERPDRASLKARLDELAETSVAPAARSIIESLTRTSLQM